MKQHQLHGFIICLFLILSFNFAAFAQEPDTSEPPPDSVSEAPPEAAAENPPEEAPSDLAAAQPEMSPIAKRNKICDCRYSTDVSYRDRRELVSGFVGVEISGFSPVNYVPTFKTAGTTYQAYYGDQQNLDTEIVFGAKVNFFLGSIGAHITGGFFSAQNTVDKSVLSIQPITAGIIYELDTLFKEPYVVPYAIGGTYTAFYSESVGGLSVSGRSPMAMFYAVGLMFQLDWLDKETHATGYEDFGLENTFLFVEGRSFLQASNPLPDLSTPLQLSGGLRVEF